MLDGDLDLHRHGFRRCIKSDHADLSEKADRFELNVSRLSKKLGIGRTSVYRSLEFLKKSGAIEYSEGTVTVLSKEILKNVR